MNSVNKSITTRGRVHRLVARLAKAILEIEQRKYVTLIAANRLLACLSWLSVKSKHQNLSPKPLTKNMLGVAVKEAKVFLKNRCVETDHGYDRAVTALAKVEQELKLMQTAETLQNSKDIID